MVANADEVELPAAFVSAAIEERARRQRSRVCSHPREFRRSLLIDCDGVSKTVEAALDPWQREDYEALDSAWARLVGKLDVADCKQRAYLERPRGHSKTTDLAVQALYALFASERKIVGVAAAAAKKQAKLLRDACDQILRLNSWLAAEIIVNNFEVRNTRTGSEFKILASDAETAMGETPDFCIVDELTHWKKKELWNSIFSSFAKRSRCVAVVIANAGFDLGHGWRWKARESCRTDPDWHFHRLDGPSASWQTAKALAEQRRILDPQAFKRLWLNIWTSGDAEGLSPEDIAVAQTLSGPYDREGHAPYHATIAALDLGISHDHAAFVVFGLDVIKQRAALLHAKRWDPKDYETHRIPLSAVREHVGINARRFQCLGVAFDPWQAELMGEDLSAMGVPMFRYPFTPANCSAMARTLKSFFADRRIDIYPEPAVVTDLHRLQFKETGMAAKLLAPRDESGHCDIGTAISIVLPWVDGTLKDFAVQLAAQQ